MFQIVDVYDAIDGFALMEFEKKSLSVNKTNFGKNARIDGYTNPLNKNLGLTFQLITHDMRDAYKHYTCLIFVTGLLSVLDGTHGFL